MSCGVVECMAHIQSGDRRESKGFQQTRLEWVTESEPDGLRGRTLKNAIVAYQENANVV